MVSILNRRTHQTVVEVLLKRSERLVKKKSHSELLSSHVQTIVLERKDASGRTAFFSAVADGHHSVVKLLLEKGADIETTGADGLAPLQRARAAPQG